MNKRLFVLFCTIILFQYIYGGDGQETPGQETPGQETPGQETSVKQCKDVTASDLVGGKKCEDFKATTGNVCKENTDKTKENKCIEVKKESTANYLKFSLAFLIFLFLF